MKHHHHLKRWHPHPSWAFFCAWMTTMGILGQAALAAPAPSGHVYRCKQDNGTHQYSQLPCSSKAELIKASDPRTPSQLQQSVVNGKQDVKLAAKMTRRRHHEERAAANLRAQALTQPVRQRQAQTHGVVSPGSVTPLRQATVNKNTHQAHKPRHFRAMVAKSTKAATETGATQAGPKQ